MGFTGIWLVLALFVQDGLGYSPLRSGLTATPSPSAWPHRRRHGHRPQPHAEPGTSTRTDGRRGRRRAADRPADRWRNRYSPAGHIFYHELARSGHAYPMAVSLALRCATGLMLLALLLAMAELARRRHRPSESSATHPAALQMHHI